MTYDQLYQRSLKIAKSLIALGIQTGDRVGVLAGNDDRYVEVVFGVTMVGGVLVVLNNAYSPIELHRALDHSGKPFSLNTSVCS